MLSETAEKTVSDSRVRTVLFGLTLLSIFAALYLIDPWLYLHIVRGWVPDALPHPFFDTEFIAAQLHCWRQGVNVFVTNPCDVGGRLMAYPPLWLHLWFLPSNPWAIGPIGLLLGIGFIVSLTVLPPITATRDLHALWWALASSACAFAVERGNVDLLIFMLVAFVVASASRSAPVRVAGYAVVLLAAELKLYPAVLLLLILRERRALAISLGFIALSIGAASIWLWQDQWHGMMPNVPLFLYRSMGPGGLNLPEGLYILARQLLPQFWPAPGEVLSPIVSHSKLVGVLYAGFLLASCGVAVSLARNANFAGFITSLGPRQRECLIAGALLFCGCFVTGTSMEYREIMLLFAIPALLSLQYEAGLPPLVRRTVWVAIVPMWALSLSTAVDNMFGPLTANGGPLPTFACWLVLEIAWWWLFTVLAAALLSASGRFAIGAQAYRQPAAEMAAARHPARCPPEAAAMCPAAELAAPELVAMEPTGMQPAATEPAAMTAATVLPRQ